MEILAVFVVIGIIVTITAPTIANVIKDSKEKTYKEQISLIEDASRTYMASHPENLPKNASSSFVTISTLKSEGLISDKDIKNPLYSTSGTEERQMQETFNGKVCVKYQNNKYTYTYKETGSC